MTILIFGDSITQGQTALKAGWVQKLFLDDMAAIVVKPGEVNTVTFNLGVDGDTTRGVINRLAHEVQPRRWEGGEVALVFAIGINDTAVWEDQPVSNPEQYAKDLRELCQAAKNHSDRIVFVGLTPVEDENPLLHGAYTNARIWQFEETLRHFVTEENIPFVPLFEAMQERMKIETMMVDGLHPNDAGHTLMYKQIKPALNDLLTTT